MDNKESAYESCELQGSLSDGEFWNAIRIDSGSHHTSRSSSSVTPAEYTASQHPSTEHPALSALLDQVTFHGSLSDGEFLDGPSRIPDLCPSPRMLKSTPSGPIKGNFETGEFGIGCADIVPQGFTACQTRCKFHADKDLADSLPNFVPQQTRKHQGSTDEPNNSGSNFHTFGVRGGGMIFEEHSQEPHDIDRIGYLTGDPYRDARLQRGSDTTKGVWFDPLVHCTKAPRRDFERSKDSACACERPVKSTVHFEDDCYVTVPVCNAKVLPYHSKTARPDCNREPNYPNNLKPDSGRQPDTHDAPPQPDIPSLTGNLLSLNPPTPHPKIFGELSDNDIYIRIAQVLDELRMLNLALAKRSQNAQDPEKSDLGTPDVPEVRESNESFYLSSASEAQV